MEPIITEDQFPCRTLVDARHFCLAARTERLVQRTLGVLTVLFGDLYCSLDTGGGGRYTTAGKVIPPPDFSVLGVTDREALPAPAWEGRRGAEAALVSGGTTVPLSPVTNTSDVNSVLLNTQTGAYNRKYRSTQRSWLRRTHRLVL